MVIIDELIKCLIKPVVEDIYSEIKSNSRQFFLNRIEDYQASLYNKCFNQKTLIHRFEEIPIDEFYIPLFIKEYTHNTNKISPKIPTNNAKELFSDFSNKIIFGSAGSGKSTLLKHIIVSAIKTTFRIPIYIELRNAFENSNNFEKYIFQNVFQYHKLGIEENNVERLILSNSFIFILDGFDEIPSSRKSKASHAIKEFIQKFSGNLFVITSRFYEPLSTFSTFKNYEICEFSNTEVTEFIRKQFSAKEISKANEIISELTKSKHTAIKDYLKTPLLLSLFIITYLTHPEIPFNKSEFYYNIFDSLFYRLDKYLKAGYVHEKQTKLSKEDFIKVLSAFSFVSYFEDKYEFTKKYIDDHIAKIKTIKNLRFDTQDFIIDLTDNVNILYSEGLGYKYPHRTLQEYFCALFISQIKDEEKKREVYKRICSQPENNLFLITILIELEYIVCLELILIPLITEYSNRLIGLIKREKFHALMFESHSYIDNIMDSNTTLRYIKYKFENEFLKKNNSYPVINLHGNISIEHKDNIYREISFTTNACHLVNSLQKHINNLKNQDRNLIDII